MSHKTPPPAKRRRPRQPPGKGRARQPLATDVLILSNGTLLVHNVTPVMAALLHKLNPHNAAIKARARCHRPRNSPDPAHTP